MKQYSGFKSQRRAGGREWLPAGGYVAKILAAKEEEYSWGNQLRVRIEIIDGLYEGFFQRDYDNNLRDDKKWHGIMTIACPSDKDDPEKDAWKKNVFNDFIACIEEGNPDFRWDWDERKLKGCRIGALFNNYEWEWNGQSGWGTECRNVCSADNILDNNYKVPKDRPLRKKTTSAPAASSSAGFAELDDDGEVPF